MTDTPDTSNPEKPTDADRIAKVIARAGVASRREAERMIIEGRVTLNGQKVTSPALDVLPSDKIAVDGKLLDAPQETRLWMYYKPVGLVTSEADEKGRQTVFDALPRDLPRVMSIGRLDLNSEGLLLLTNDGELKRRLELPTTGWLRRYRVRVNGQPSDLTFAPLRRGVTIDGEDFAPMEIKLDSQKGANAWLTVGIREGKNREIRRAMAHVGLQVNRLIRIGYGPFKLTGMEENEVREIKRRVLRDQLGGLLTGEAEDKPRDFRERGSSDGDRKPRGRFDDNGPRGEGRSRPDRAPRAADAERPRFDRAERGDRSGQGQRGDRPRFKDKDARPFDRDDRGKGPRSRREDGDNRGTRGDRPGNRGERGGYAGKRDDGGRGYAGKRDEGGRGFGPKRGAGAEAERKSYGDRPARGPRKDGMGKGKPGEGRFRDDSNADGPRKPRYPKPAGGGKPGFKKSAGPAKGPRSGGTGSGKPRKPRG